MLAAAGNPINIGLWAIINSCFSIGGLIGSYGVVLPLALLGRKRTLMLTNIFVFLSYVHRLRRRPLQSPSFPRASACTQASAVSPTSPP